MLLFRLIHLVFFPVIWSLAKLIPSLHKRFQLETTIKIGSRDLAPGEICFEVSSEGELEQVYPLLEKCLQTNMPVDLIFFSPSVMKKCLELQKRFNNLRVFMYPLLTTIPFVQELAQILKGKTLILCRYDFWPALLSYGQRPGVNFVLLNATLKGKENVNPLKRAFLKYVYQSFDLILTARKEDERLLTRDYSLRENQLITGDLRSLRIMKRLESKEKVLGAGELAGLMNWLNQVNKSKRIIFGSAWEVDLELLNNQKILQSIKNDEIRLVVAPHQLTGKSIETLQYKLGVLGLTSFVYNGNDSKLSPGQVCLLNRKGILCEMYTLFDFAYVGGGFGRSIHSVMEPFLAGAKVMCGPRTHRSTEFDLCQDFSNDHIGVILNAEQLYASVTSAHVNNEQILPMVQATQQALEQVRKKLNV